MKHKVVNSQVPPLIISTMNMVYMMEVSIPGEDKKNEETDPGGSTTPQSVGPEPPDPITAKVQTQELDWTYLREVSDGDEEFFAHALTQLCAQIMEFLRRIELAHGADNSIELRAAIHRIQPSFTMIGQGRLIALLKEISLHLKSGEKSCLDLTHEVDRVRAISREILDRVECYHRQCCG